MTMRASIAAEHGTLRDRRGYPSDEVNLCAYPVAIRERKMYAVQVARTDGKHLTLDDYIWIRRCLALRDEPDAAEVYDLRDDNDD
jgi:hypothetical protein